jgi:NAD+ diphosphatase
MLGFRAKYAGGELKPDGYEITDAGWYSRDNLPEIPGPGAIARFLIDQWREGKLK